MLLDDEIIRIEEELKKCDLTEKQQEMLHHARQAERQMTWEKFGARDDERDRC